VGARLIVFAGVPGVGKSAVADGVARALGLPILSVDPIEEGMAEAGIPPSFTRGLAAYLVAARSARHVLELGQGVIVEAANAEPEGRSVWHDLGARTGVAPTWVHVTCSDPDLHRSRLEGRTPGYPGIEEPTWEAVTARAAGFATWTDDRITVDTAHPLPTTVSHVLTALEAPSPPANR
jgi:predicted kinase